MTGNHQQATATSDHLLNSAITPAEKLFDGYDPKKFTSEQHGIGSKHHPWFIKGISFIGEFY